MGHPILGELMSAKGEAVKSCSPKDLSHQTTAERLTCTAKLSFIYLKLLFVCTICVQTFPILLLDKRPRRSPVLKVEGEGNWGGAGDICVLLLSLKWLV